MIKKIGHNRLTNRHRDIFAGSLFFLPWIIGFFAITLYPLIYSLVISFNAISIKTTGTELTPKGWEYFRTALTLDSVFPEALLRSLFLIVTGVPLIIVFSLIVALLLSRKFKGRGFFRAIFFLPVVIISGPMINELLSETQAMTLQFDFGRIMKYLYELDFKIFNPFSFFMENLLQVLWFSGVQILIFIVIMQKIDRSMYEVASIDGATGWEMFWRITIPYLRPAILLNTIYTIVEMGAFSNDPTNIKIMAHLLEVNRPYSYSAAMSWIYASALLLLILIVFLLLNDWKSMREMKK